MTASQAAIALSVGHALITKWLRTGVLPGRLVHSQQWHITAEEVCALRARRRSGVIDRVRRPARGRRGDWRRGRQFVPRVACVVCGELFYASPSEIKKKGRAACSDRCAGQLRSRRHIKQRAVKTCRWCGCRFEVYPSHAEKRKTCGRNCPAKPAALHRERRQREAKHGGNCKQCGKAIQHGRVFCGRRCRVESTRKPIQLAVCESCGVMYPPSRGSRGRFCSMRCMAKQRGVARALRNPYSGARGGRRSDLDGRYFRSTWEANYARYLNWLMSIGEVRSWEYEAKTFEFVKIRRGNRFYTPDFLVTWKNGTSEFHEVKGYMDPESQTKLRRMAKYFPATKVVVISHPEYRDIRRKVSALIPGWESNGH